jgi:hypothetical protein
MATTHIPRIFSYREEIAKLKKQSQAGTVLVSAAALNVALEGLLLGRMRDLSNTEYKRIFGRPLNDLAPKIDVAYAFELIDAALYDDLRIIKDIRNEFAHPEGPVDFRTPKIIELVSRFKSSTSDGNSFALFNERVKTCAEKIEARTQQDLFTDAVNQGGRDNRKRQKKASAKP